MREAAKVKKTLERAAKATAARPSVGQGTARTRATLGDGLWCTVEEGPFRFVAGMTEKYGGGNEGPNPGTLGRGALASCLALGIAMWAARMDVPIDALEVDVAADYDVRGELGVAPDVVPGYSAMRYDVRITSSAPEPKVREMLDRAIRTSSYLDNFARAVRVSGDLHIARR